jgi:predicted flap endonuclease-1-like 5' DNA nuclease
MDFDKFGNGRGGLFFPILCGVVAFVAVYAWREGPVGGGGFFALLLLTSFLLIVRAMAQRAEAVNRGDDGAAEAPAMDRMAPTPAATPAPVAAPVDEAVGKRPIMLESARAGQPDDLKQIKGVGPRLEAMLHRLGFFHFDQIANWTPQEVAWVDEHLEGFKGRVSRDGWVAQAKILAAGGETEFSKRVEEGEVYE